MEATARNPCVSMHLFSKEPLTEAEEIAAIFRPLTFSPSALPFHHVLESQGTVEYASRDGGRLSKLFSAQWGYSGWLFRCSDVLEMSKWGKNRTEEILVSNSSPVSGPSEASGVKFTWSQGFQGIARNR